MSDRTHLRLRRRIIADDDRLTLCGVVAPVGVIHGVGVWLGVF